MRSANLCDLCVSAVKQWLEIRKRLIITILQTSISSSDTAC
jgi:hypothetical protein